MGDQVEGTWKDVAEVKERSDRGRSWEKSGSREPCSSPPQPWKPPEFPPLSSQCGYPPLPKPTPHNTSQKYIPPTY